MTSNAYLMNANLVTWLSELTNLPFFQQTSPITSIVAMITTAPKTEPKTAPTTAPGLIPPLSRKGINTCLNIYSLIANYSSDEFSAEIR